MKRYEQVSAFILAGGVSSRMGKPKALLAICGEPLIIRTARIVKPLVSLVTVVGSPDRYADLGLQVIADQDFFGPDHSDENRGPLAGIATALTATRTEWNLILACDLPYLTRAWLDWLLARAIGSQAEVLMPRTARGPEPLAAVYRRECAERIITVLKQGIRKVTDAMEQFRTEIVTERDWQHVEPNGGVLCNMNTRDDYERARKRLES